MKAPCQHHHTHLIVQRNGLPPRRNLPTMDISCSQPTLVLSSTGTRPGNAFTVHLRGQSGIAGEATVGTQTSQNSVL